MTVIRALSIADCEEVLRINAASLPGVARLDRAEFERLIALPNAHLALEGTNGGLAAYLLAFPDSALYDGEEFRTFQQSTPRPFIYIDQVAVDANMRRAGAGSALYTALETRARDASVVQLCCEVNLDPPNPTSLAFHERVGFEQIAALVTADGRTVALMIKRYEVSATSNP